jgi:hypothetical protein
VLFTGSPDDADALLRAMRLVATGEGRHPLSEVAPGTLGVPALLADDAADGHYPDWYTPSA